MRHIRVISGFGLALLLSSCGAYDFAREKYTGERSGEEVAGPRRAPILNPSAAKPEVKKMHVAASNPIVPSGPAPSTVPEKTQASAKDSPYDQFDEKGEAKGGTNYLAKLFDGDEATHVSSSSGRKSFKGNVAQSSVAAAPISSAPISVEPFADPAEKIIPKAAVEAPAQPEITPAPRGGKGNGVMIPLSQLEPVSQLEPSAGGNEIAANDTPALKTVPQKPAQFEVIKKEKDAQLKQLQQDHKNADAQKTLLNAEPSDLKLPEVEDTLEEIQSALESSEPLIASNSYIQEASPSSGR